MREYDLITNICNLNNLGLIIKDYKVNNIHLISTPNCYNHCNELKVEIEKFKYNIVTHKISNNIWKESIQLIKEITNQIQDKEKILLLISPQSNRFCNICLVDYASLIGALNNGIKVLALFDEKIIMFPYMKMQSEDLISDKKLKILEVLKEQPLTPEQISGKIGVSLPLISYHLNGNINSKGLKTMGFVELENKKQNTIKLTTFGELIVDGGINFQK